MMNLINKKRKDLNMLGLRMGKEPDSPSNRPVITQQHQIPYKLASTEYYRKSNRGDFE